MSKNTLTITDNRTGKNYELPITDGTIRTVDLRQIKAGDEDFGLMGYDPAYLNTASCRSAITLIDGDKGILRYRGYPIEQLAERWARAGERALCVGWGHLSGVTGGMADLVHSSPGPQSPVAQLMADGIPVQPVRENRLNAPKLVDLE